MISNKTARSGLETSHLALCVVLFGLTSVGGGTMAATPSAESLVSGDVGTITIIGNGCSNADLRAPYDSATGRVSLRFHDYAAEAAVGTPRRLTRKTCQIAIPVQVAEDERIVISDLSFRGRADLQRQTSASVSLEAFFAGDTGERLVKTIATKSDPARRYIGLREHNTVLQGKCGRSGTVRFNTSAMLPSTKSAKKSDLKINTLRFRIEAEKCPAE